MQKLTSSQIEQIKAITSWQSTKFHGNTKTVGELPIELFKDIVKKKVQREIRKQFNYKESEATKTLRHLKYNLSIIDSNYFKIMIEGNSGIYLAHPVYQHQDYNKHRMFDKTEKTIRLMNLYNTIVNKN